MNTTITSPIDVHLNIGDKQLADGTDDNFEHVNAHTGEVQASVPMAGAADIDAAVRAAAKAQEDWRRTKPADRRDALLRLAHIVRDKSAEFSRMISLENGTPISNTQVHGEIAYAWITYYAGWADKLEGRVSSTFAHGRDFSYSVPEPVGVVGALIPWNGPLHCLAMKTAPALAAGNSVVLKPSEFAPFSGELYARCVREAGIPDGVCNVVPGGRVAGDALVRHPLVNKISFTGGPATAHQILAACAETAKPSLMELGGKSANVVFADADLDLAAMHATMFSVHVWSGQGCIFPTRLIVQESVYEEVLERCIAQLDQIVMGDPFDPTSTMGPVVSHPAAERIIATVKGAVESGDGRLVTGGCRAEGDLAQGAYVQPTIFADVDPASSLAQNEVFGPVLAVSSFRDEEQAIELANGTPYGLGAFLHCNDLNTVHRVADGLKAGGVFVNGALIAEPDTPFGGVGISGFGREGGLHGIEEYTALKTVAIAAPVAAA
jgi:aldehyde dehydrogenase (NAD+)